MEILFALLHTLCAVHFGQALYAIYHSKVEQDYLRMRRDFQRQDPLELTNDLRRVQLCDKVLKANTYFYARYNDEFHAESRRTSGSSKSSQQSVNRRNAQLRHFNSASASTSDVSKYQYNLKYVLVGTAATRMRAFLCSEGKRAELFVTFGFRDEHAFLLTKPKHADESALRIRAMLAPTPKLVTHISFGVANGHRRMLDNYFWQFFPARRPNYSEAQYYPVLEFMQLCWLADDEYRHADVCSSIANTLNKYEHFRQDLHLEISKSNYVKKIATSVGCIDRALLNDGTGELDQVNIRALPCALNRYGWSQPQFYLLRDPNLNFQSSVFVLKPHRRSRVLTLEAYVSDVSSLANARHTRPNTYTSNSV